ncbi:unnamed protein product [Rotaria magnacalcarata]|uniref:Uncharacterized protein n=3 Tax=Rotaria magnacalcarata TaxID=392030 RepID=A0A816WDJ6_9BILA|nr:unnamed protein product [Rotaria magnacalcarata]
MSFQMSFLLTGLVQYGDETELVDVYVGSSLADVHAQLVAPFGLDPNECTIQVFESKIFNEYINLSKISLITNMDSGRFRIMLKKVDLLRTQNTPTRSHTSQILSNRENASPLHLNHSQTSSSHLDSLQGNLSLSYKDHLDQMSFDDENDSPQMQSFDSVESPTICQRESKGKRDLDKLRDLPSLISSNMLPSFPIRIKSAISTGLLNSVIQEVVNMMAHHLVKFNVSSKIHYAQIRIAFVKEYSMNEFRDNRDLDLLMQKLSRRIRDLRSHTKKETYRRRPLLDWDSNRFSECVSQVDPSTTNEIGIADSTQRKEFIKTLNDAFNNNEMMKGTTTQIIVDSFRLRRSYLQLGQTMEQILNEMRFTQHIIFIKLEFELVTKISLLVATQRIRKFLDNIISYEMYGQLREEHFLDEVGTIDLIPLLKNDNLYPLLYSCSHHNQTYFYLTYAKQILMDFDTQTDVTYALAILLATYYVFDIKYPRHNKPILEVLDYIALHESVTDTRMKTSLLKRLTISAQSVITEYEKKLLA